MVQGVGCSGNQGRGSSPLVKVAGFEIQDLGCRVSGSRCGMKDVGCRV